MVEKVGGKENFLIKDNAKLKFMLPKTQKSIFKFKIIHCNGYGYMMAVIILLMSNVN